MASLTRFLPMLPVLLLAGCGGDSGDSTSPGTTALASLEFIWNGAPLAQGDSLRMNVVFRGANGTSLSGRPVTWTSSDPAIATVSSSGVVKGVSRIGAATITAASEGKRVDATVTTYWGYAVGRMPTYKVTAAPLTFRDEVRKRNIPIMTRIPMGAPEPVPVVFDVFPLPNGERVDENLADRIAQAGYVVIHVGTAAFDQTQLCTEMGVSTDCSEMIWPGRLATRRDVGLLMDSLSLLGRLMKVRLDSTRVAVTGSSAGGAVTMYLAGATVDVTPSVTGVSLGDARFAAFLANSAPALVTDNGSATGFRGTSWASVRKPTMQQVLAADVDAAGRRGIYDVMPPGDKYLVAWNAPGVSSYDPSRLDSFGTLIESIALAFFDTYLRGSAEARQWLTTNELARGSNGGAQLSTK